MKLTIDSTPEDVQEALDDNEAAYYRQVDAIDAEAKRQKKELLADRIERRQALKALLKVVKTVRAFEVPDASGGHAAVGDRAAEEVAAGPGGKDS